MPTPATTAQEALASLDAFISANPGLAKEDPQQFARLTRMRDSLKKQPANKPASDEVKKLALELFRWQLDLQRAEYQSQLDAVSAAHAKAPSPILEKTKGALTEVVKFLDQARGVDFPPTEAALAASEKAVARVQQAFAEAQQLAATSTEGIDLKPVKRPIVSSSGVALKPAMPPPRNPRR